jgi:hypothetical protein
LESIYLLHPPSYPWIGPFARFRLDTSVAPGYHVSGQQETYRILAPDGSLDETRVGDPDGSRLKLSDAFMPLTLRESVGVFVKPYADEPFNLELKSGLGAQETFADDQRAMADDSATPEIEIQQLRNVFQAGPVFGVDIWGALLAKCLSYYAKFEAMIPVVNNQLSSDNRDTLDLTNYLVDAGISLELVTWATLKYQFKLVREPQVLDATQIQHNLLLNFNYTFLSSDV